MTPWETAAPRRRCALSTGASKLRRELADFLVEHAVVVAVVDLEVDEVDARRFERLRQHLAELRDRLRAPAARAVRLGVLDEIRVAHVHAEVRELHVRL